jgi:hypothetical protein
VNETTRLTDHDRRVIAQAAELAARFDIAAVRKSSGTTDTIIALAETLGTARHHIRDLLAIIARLDGHAGPDASSV